MKKISLNHLLVLILIVICVGGSVKKLLSNSRKSSVMGYEAREQNPSEVENSLHSAESILKISAAPTLTLTPTVTPDEKPKAPSPKPQPSPTPTTIPQPKYSSAEINSFIERFSGQYGVDPNVIRHIAICESGFRADAKSGPYAGLFQFASLTWRNARIPIGEDPNPNLRFNAEEAIQTAAYLVAKGKKNLWPHCYP